MGQVAHAGTPAASVSEPEHCPAGPSPATPPAPASVASDIFLFGHRLLLDGNDALETSLDRMWANQANGQT